MKLRILVAVLFVIGLIVCTGCDSSKSKKPPDGPLESLTLGTSAITLSSLIWVAKAKGYFAQQHLDIDFRLYESGHPAIRDLFAGKLGLATATEFAAVRHGLEHADFRIIFVLCQAQGQQLVARSDRGITQLSDLRNKRVGLVNNTSSDYYLHLLLNMEKIQSEDIDRIFVIFQRLHKIPIRRHGDGSCYCQEVVEHHGRKIWAESEPGAATTFCFTISDRGIQI
ncbi:MAG TPA: ABC transporter substrate-binding protein [Desulfomonilaceae bacterium]|nr:ABC transporter substrate-binding protein [Desulfomonilaceae bacterium]